ncbi:MAG: ribosomal RNA small subunit methyltransferase A [Lachnospiraceae bacterium]|nr:ribosomal RNA small subunit methyltransferase A [Lachnospiraceae bacterium]
MKSNPKNFKFKHSLGQNFIVDEFLLEDIADESGITKDDFVLEIGPGNGALTRCLCDRAKKVVAIEIDKSLIPLLKSNLKDYENVSIINADFMELDFNIILNEFPAPRAHIKVVANLPYYITSPIINILLQNPYVSEMTLMVQKEVAERIVATPGGKDYGILTLACNYFADTEMIMVVSKDCFFPKPKVDSAVVHFKKHPVGADLRRGEFHEPDYDQLFKLIKASFAQRRKKLLNSLTNAGYDKDTVAHALSELGFDENVRAENLSLDDYKHLLTFFI